MKTRADNDGPPGLRPAEGHAGNFPRSRTACPSRVARAARAADQCPVWTYRNDGTHSRWEGSDAFISVRFVTARWRRKHRKPEKKSMTPRAFAHDFVRRRTCDLSAEEAARAHPSCGDLGAVVAAGAAPGRLVRARRAIVLVTTRCSAQRAARVRAPVDNANCSAGGGHTAWTRQLRVYSGCSPSRRSV